jgi:hygromycin-B 4-O-kinase
MLPEVDVASVRDFITGRFGGAEGIVRLAGGAWSRAFGFRAGGRDLVVRFGPFAEDYQKDRVAASWCRDDLPVPEVLEIGEAFDGHYAVSQRVSGAPIEDLDARGWRRVLPSLFGALVALRAVELPGSGFGRWRPDGSAPHDSWRRWLLSIADDPLDVRVHGWRERMASVPSAEARFDEGYGMLTDLAEGCPEVRHVIHGDLTAHNVLVRDDRITGVFDWANSVAGDPLYDVAWLTFWAPWHPGLDGLDLLPVVGDHFDEGGLDDRLRCYAVHVGLDAQQYNAYTSRWEELARTADRTLEVARA